MSGGDKQDRAREEFEDAEYERILREENPKFLAALERWASTGDVRDLPDEVIQFLLSDPQNLQEFATSLAIDCRASEIGGLRVLWHRRIRLGGWWMKLRAKWALRKLLKEQREIMVALTNKEKLLFFRNVCKGIKEAEEHFAQFD